MRCSNLFHLVTTSVTLLAVAILMTSTAFAVTITDMRDSTAFNYQYTGADLASSSDWSGYPDGVKPPADVEGDYLRYDVGNDEGMFTWLNSLPEANGWTVEISLQVTQPGNPTYPSVITGIVSDGTAGEYNYINIGEGAVYAGTTGELNLTLVEKDMTDGFHQVRIAQAPNSGLGDTHVWVDGELVSETIKGLGSHAILRHWWGKGSGNQTQGECLIEYMRVDTTGGYGPDGWVYEPPAPLPQKNSDAFTYRYEMNVDPVTQDLDINSTNDFEYGGDTMTTSDGKLTYNSTVGDGSYCKSTAPGGIWEGENNFLDGYTIEVSLKVNSNAPDSDAAFSIFSSLAGNSSTSFLTVGAGGQGWGGDDLVLGENNNSDGFHIFRLVQHPDEDAYSVWRDDVLIGDKIARGYTYADEIMYFGDGSGSWGGDVEIDYFRFMPGAFAPDPSEYLPGDANRSGTVDAADAAILAANWLSSDDVGWYQGDFNGDGVVDDIDATILASNWQQSTAGASVPEPGCLALVLGLLFSLACVNSRAKP